MSRAISPTGRQAHSCCPAPKVGTSGCVRANRRDIRIDFFVEAVRLSFLKVPDRTSFGVRPHSDTTLRNQRLRYATTQRVLKDGTRTHSEGPRAGSSGTDPGRNWNATDNSLDAWNALPGLVFRERRENSRHIQATRRHDSVCGMIFDLTVSSTQRNQRFRASQQLWTTSTGSGTKSASPTRQGRHGGPAP